MHGIQHLFRQHAIEKQVSTDSWHSAATSNGTLNGQVQCHDLFDGTRNDSVESASDSSMSKSPSWSQGECKFA